MKKLVVLMLMLSFVFVGCSGDEGEDKLQASELTDKYQVESKSDENTNGDLVSIITYPVIKDLIDKRIEEKINGTIAARIEDYKSLTDISQELGIEETLKVWYEVPYKSKEKLSIKFFIQSYIKDEDYTDITIDTFNFDLNNGEDLALADLFKIKKYKDKLNSIVQAQFNNLEVQTNKEFAGLEDEQAYYLKDGNLVIFYQTLVYTDDEPLEFEIPLADLTDVLKAPIP